MVNSQNFTIFGLMEQKRFLELLRDPQIINKQDAGELLELKSNFPYFHLAHILTTLAAHQNNSMYFEEFLKRSALLTTNRKKLKQLIDSIKKTADASPIKEETSIATEENIAILKEELTEPESIMVPEELIITEEIPSLVAEQAPEIKEEETNILLNDLEEVVTVAEKTEEHMIINTVETSEKHDLTRVAPSNHVESTLLHTNTIDNYRHQESPFQNAEVDAFNDLISKFLENTFEISKPKPQDAIDSFLNNPPKSIKNTFIPEENEAREDLSEKFTSNSNDFFSESLAKIYTKQKKYAKAIETYKKLILTNPQKSAYFASKILEIENLL